MDGAKSQRIGIPRRSESSVNLGPCQPCFPSCQLRLMRKSVSLSCSRALQTLIMHCTAQCALWARQSPIGRYNTGSSDTLPRSHGFSDSASYDRLWRPQGATRRAQTRLPLMIFATARRLSTLAPLCAASCTGKALPGGIRGECGPIDVSYG